jgi:hypothetical protein
MSCCNMVWTWRWSCPTTANPTSQLQSEKQDFHAVERGKMEGNLPSRCAEASCSDTRHTHEPARIIWSWYVRTWECANTITMQSAWDRVHLVSTAFHVNVSKSRMLRSFIRRLLESSPPNITRVEPTSVTDWPPRAIWSPKKTHTKLNKHPSWSL